MSKHDIYYGDSLKLLPQMSDSAQLVVTSPPYYNAREYSQYESYDDYLNFIDEITKLISNILIEGGYYCVNSTTITKNKVLYPIPFDILKIANKHGFELVWDIIWMKPKHTQALWRSSDYNYRKPYPYTLYLNCFHEYVWILRKGSSNRKISEDILEKNKIKGGKIEIKGKEKDSKILDYSYREWYINVATPEKEGHSAPFPVELAKYCIELFSLKGDTVLDPFLGSGTTTKAAIQLDRNSIGIELGKKHFKSIKKKLIPKSNLFNHLSPKQLPNGFQEAEIQFHNIFNDEKYELISEVD